MKCPFECDEGEYAYADQLILQGISLSRYPLSFTHNFGNYNTITIESMGCITDAV